MKKYTIEAAQFCDAIRELANKPENLQSLESYLEWHFDKWLEKNWKNAAGIAVIVTSAIFIPVGRNAPDIWP